MKIRFLVYNIFGMGGTVRTVVNTANYLQTQKFDVEIISIRKTSSQPMFHINKGIKIRYLVDARKGGYYQGISFTKKTIKRVLNRIPSMIIDKSEDLYHMFNIFSDIKIYRALKSIKDGILITTIPSFNILSAKLVDKRVYKIGQEHRNFMVHSEGLRKKIVRNYPDIHMLTCLTDSEVDMYKKTLPKSDLEIYKIENATDIPLQKSTLESKVVIAAGRLVHEKGYDLLIEAFEKVSLKHPDWKLKIFGNGVEKDKLQQLIQEKKLYNNIYLMHKTSDIINEMRKASIYALSSRHESFGMVIIEAMSVGIPTVSFNCPGPAEVISNNEDGIVVGAEDVDALADGIIKLIEDNHLRYQFGQTQGKCQKVFH